MGISLADVPLYNFNDIKGHTSKRNTSQMKEQTIHLSESHRPCKPS